MELAKGKEMVKYKNEIFFGEFFFPKKKKKQTECFNLIGDSGH